MVTLRRITVVAGLAAMVVQELIGPGRIEHLPLILIAGAVALYNEVGRLLLVRVRDHLLARVLNAQIALDTLALVTVVHFGGGFGSLCVLFFAPAFFAYGATLPTGLTLVHVVLATLELSALGVVETLGLVGGATPTGEAAMVPAVIGIAAAVRRPEARADGGLILR
jgi:hypothetical protein